MKASLLRLLILTLLLGIGFHRVLGQDEPTITDIEIRHIGPPAASDALVRANIRVRAGDAYNPQSVSDDIRTLYSTGLFYAISEAREPTPNGIKLIYYLQGNPTLTDIRFDGNKKYSRNKLMRQIKSKVGEPLDEKKLFFDSREIQKLYQKAGYQKTEVKAVPAIDPSTGTGTVTFEVHEAAKVKIKDVIFQGAEAFSQRKLRKVLKTRRHWWLSWLTGGGVLKDEQFEEDKQRLADFYHEHGYIDFELKDVQFEYLDASHLILHFIITEGRQYKVGAVSFKDNTLFTGEQIIDGARRLGEELKLTVGSVFTPKDLTHDIESVRDFYGSRGYIDVWVKANEIPNTETGTMDLSYEIHDEDKGISHIEKIEIRGNTKTKDRVIRRELAVSPGEVFDMVRVNRSKGRLEQLLYFDKVETEIEPTEVANHKNLVIDVEEGSTGNFEFGAGFSSVDNLVGFVGYREGNFDLFNPPYFRGGGQKLRISAQVGTRRRDFQISFTEPWFLGRKLALGTDLYYRDLNFFSDLYDVTEAGTRLSLSRALGSDFLIGSVSYTIENIGINHVDPSAPLVIRMEPNNRLVTKFGGSIAWDTRNNVMLPNGGQRTELLTEVAGPFGGDTDFYKLEMRSSWYFPGLFEGHIIELGGRAGVVENYGRTDRVPLFDRYFLGGVYSLRGYKYREVGPHQDDEPIGGETFWFGTLEYSIPIIERLRFAVFYDIGNVYLNAYSFDLDPDQKVYNDNWGVGLRLNIPRLGPLRLDYGIPITHDRFTSGSGRFQFSVGFQREF